MRNPMETLFWKRAWQSLPPQVQARYETELRAAERRELGLQAALDLISRARHAVAALFSAPRPQH